MHLRGLLGHEEEQAHAAEEGVLELRKSFWWCQLWLTSPPAVAAASTLTIAMVT
jgi:hypothetical protein